MLKFTELERCALKDKTGFPAVSLLVMGDCATQHLCRAICGCGYLNGIDLRITETDYDQTDMEISDPESDIFKCSYDYVLLMMCREKLYDEYCKTQADSRREFAEKIIERLKLYWNEISSRIPGVRIIQSDFPVTDDFVFGQYSNKNPASFLFQTRRLDMLIMENVSGSKYKNVSVLDVDIIEHRFGYERFHDSRTYYIGKLPAPIRMLPALAERTVDIIQSYRGAIHKCIICDLDNTLWGGVIGDDGMDRIQIGELGEGQAFSALQRWIKELKERGVIVAVCSKNDYDVAREPFISHPEMVLRLEDISMFVANWDDKVTNIRHIQSVLNIGMDSIVFIDDNPFERNIVRDNIPGICVPELPDDPMEYLDYLKSLNLFETASYSDEDKKRTEQYQAEISRSAEREKFENYGDYLVSLDMEATASLFESFYYPRIAQLTQRSNQFNLRTVRYTEDDIQRISESNDYIALYFTLKDKYGDHGLISVVILKKQDAGTLFVEEWLMSCRVLKRGVEELVCDTIVECAKLAGCDKVVGEYLPTQKNKMVSGLYLQMGFRDEGNGRFETDVSEYVPHETAIRVSKRFMQEDC